MRNSIGSGTVVPQCLAPGDRIGIVAPSGSFDDALFRQGIETIREMGFRPVIPETLFRKKRYFAGTDPDRALLVNQMFADDAVKAILCARGGYGASRLLPYLDWRAICTHPKIFMGFSDVSVLLTAFYTRCGLVTFHGPMVTSLPLSDAETKTRLKAVLSVPTPLTYAPDSPIVIRSGIACGPVTGGNLCTLCHLAGTPFAPSLVGHILFLEDCGEPTYKIDRMLTQLKMCGWIDGISGLILGSFERCGDAALIFDIIEEVTADVSIPVMGGFEIGHGRRNLVLPIGLEATLDTDRGRLVFCRPATSVAKRHQAG